ncbi:MAG: PilZ domain-containing protein [Candidatus Omnitrophota bacterium]
MPRQNPESEKRKFLRINEEDVLVCEPFDVSVLDGVSVKRAHVVTKDLSEGGLLFESGEAFAIGTILKLQVDIPGWEKYKREFFKADQRLDRQPLIVLAKVVRIEDVGGGHSDVGVAFVALDSGHRLALRKYLKITGNK